MGVCICLLSALDMYVRFDGLLAWGSAGAPAADLLTQIGAVDVTGLDTDCNNTSRLHAIF